MSGATRRTVRIGLTGPIGCGKSTVGRWLGARGAVVVDADAVARDVTAPGEPATDTVLARFGNAYRAADGGLDRPALAALVFGDERALRDLEAIVHPAVRSRILAALDGAERAGASAVVVEAIKLVEGGLAELCDEVWLVVCPGRAQRERLVARGMAPPDADRRIAAQVGLADRLRPAATRVIDAGGTAAETERIAADAFAAALGPAAGSERDVARGG